MRICTIFCCRMVLSLLAFLSVTDMFAQWSQWRGPLRDGICKEVNLLKVWPAEGPRLAWSVDTVGDGFSSTAIQNGMAFTTGKRDSVEIITALDLNGNVKWQKVFGRAFLEDEWPQSRSTPTIYENKVYAVSVLGDIACFDSEGGNLEWKIQAFEEFKSAGYNIPAHGIAESPLVVEDKLIFTPSGQSTSMVALNRLTGETIWKTVSLADTTGYTSPVLFTVNNKTAIFTSMKINDIIVDYNTGDILWKDKHISGLIPVVHNNQIYYTGEYKKGGTLCSWNDELNKRYLIWQDTVSANSIGGAVLYRDKLFVPGNSKGIMCIDYKTGEVLFHYKDINYCTLLIADDMLYAYEDRNGKVSLFKMNEDSLELVSSFKITSGNGPRIAHMAISNGLLFIRHGNVLMAYDLKQQSNATSSVY